MDVTFDDIVVTHPASNRTLLSHVSGRLQAGTLTALMGPSGQGKTTLLTTLGRRFEPTLNYQGTVRFNGAKWRVSDKRRVAFVPQDDIFPTGLTVQEYLNFSSRLRLANLPEEERVDRVQTLLKRLRLEKCADTLMGGPAGARGISGGERKRACIANELLTNPLLLLCDEVTSGLDSQLAQIVVDTLLELSRDGRLSVCCTIHQPSSALFSRFDELLALDEGRVFYRGRRADLANFMQRIGRPNPPLFNAADHLLDILVLDEGRKTDPLVVSVMKENQSWSSSSSTALASQHQLSKAQSVLYVAGTFATSDKEEREFAAPFLTQVAVLLRRMFKKERPGIFTIQTIACNLGLTLLVSVMFWQLGYGIQDAQLRSALAFWQMGTGMYLSFFSVLFALHEEEPVLRKDLFDSSYSLLAYFLAKTLVVIPNTAFWTLIFSMVSVAATNAAPTVPLAISMVFSMQLNILTLQGLGFIISASFPPQHTLVAAILVVMSWFGLAGLFAPPTTMPVWLGWTRYIDPQAYTWQILMRTVFQPEVVFWCDESTARTNSLCFGSPNTTLNGNGALEQFEVDIALWVSIVVLLVTVVLSRCVAFFFFWRRAKRWSGATLFRSAAERMPDAVLQTKLENSQVDVDETPSRSTSSIEGSQPLNNVVRDVKGNDESIDVV